MYDGEFIVCSAILTTEWGKSQLGGAEFVTGLRHSNIFQTYRRCSSSPFCQRGPEAQGFMTSTGRFVNREEALEIFKICNPGVLLENRTQLLSEDLY